MKGLARTDQSLHVLLTTDVVGGVWDFCCVLAAELIRVGNRVTLLAFGSPSPAQRRQADTAGGALIDAPLRLEWMRDSAEDVDMACSRTAQLVRDSRVDILHVNQYALGQVDAGVPVILTAHSDALSWLKWTVREGKDGPVPDEWTNYVSLVRRGLRAAGAVVAVSHFLADERRRLYRVNRQIGVIYNGWAPGPSAPTPIADRVRLTFLAGRAWDSAKNIQLVTLAAQGWEVGRVLLAGEQRHPESGGLAQFDPPIETLGRVSREAIDRYLAEARVYLAPARYEPFGLLPLQAALAGCPLLLSDIASFRELWSGAAVFFRSDDAADLRRQWAHLLANDGLAAGLAGRAWRLAAERYGAARMAADYTSLYWDLLTAHRLTGHGETGRLGQRATA